MASKVLVLVGDDGQMRGKSHAPDCSHAQTWATRGHGRGYGVRPYKLIDASAVPDHIGRCAFCGGGR